MDKISLKACVLSSGSKGNVTFISSSSTNLLVDIGTSCLYVEKKLKELNLYPNQIDGILITHIHVDHISGLAVFLKKYNPTVYLTEKMYNELIKNINIQNYVFINEKYTINDINVECIKTSHDTPDSNGYIFEKDEKSIVYITDTGYIHEKYHKQLLDKDLYIFESNHDVEMLLNGKYPYHLKQRILGDYGHLSNKDSAYYLSKFVGEKTKKIILAHLSEENNDPTIALNTLLETLNKSDKNINDIIIATQNEMTEVIEL